MKEKLCVCGNTNCDSPFHKGDKVEVQWGNVWVQGEVIAEARTRVTVKFPHPIFYTAKKIIVTKNFWGKKSVTEEWEDEILKSMTFGASYVRFPETKSWERP